MDTKDNKDLINISHEFKGPVTSLKIILETLYEYDEFMSSSKKKELIELALKESNRLKDLSDYFLNEKQDLKTAKFTKERYIFPFFSQEIVQFYPLLALYRKSFLISYFYNNSENNIIFINKELYFQVLLNLLGNAIKFNIERGWIVVELDVIVCLSLSSFVYKKYARSCVIDNGLGYTNFIESAIRSKEVILSFRAKRLGLNIVKDILLFHKTFLNGTSYPFRGAKLFFTISTESCYL